MQVKEDSYVLRSRSPWFGGGDDGDDGDDAGGDGDAGDGGDED